MNRPRLLALAGVAVGGVLAVKAVSGVEALPELITGARAFAAAPASAETAPAKAAPKPAAAKTPPAACAPGSTDFAREAGLSPAELRVLQSLGDRRGELDAREKQLETQLQLLAAAEAKLDAKVKALEGLKGEMKGLLAQAETKDQAEVARLVKVYESMKPKDAAAVMARLDDKVRLPVAGAMKERLLAAVLSQMKPEEAKTLTEKLAARYDAADGLKAKVAAAQAAEPVRKPPTKG